MRARSWITFVTVVTLPMASIALPTAVAHGAGAPQTAIVSTVPSAATPNVNDGTVLSITQVGSRIIVGGSFTNVSPPGQTTNAVTRKGVFAFDATSGAIDTGFAPVLDGTVEGVTPGPSADTVYVAGYFNNVNGVKAKGVALLSTINGTMVAGFKPAPMDGAVWAVQRSGSHLLITGTFMNVNGVAHAGIAALNPTTGAVDPYVNIQLAGHHNYNGTSGYANAAVGGRRMDISADGSRLILVGNFKTADGLLRDQIVMIDLGSGAATVDQNWATAGFSAACYYWAYDTYVRDVSFSPDGSYFAVAATGGGDTSARNTDNTRSNCDTTTRWTTTATGSDVQPVWVDHTGNDSFESVTVTSVAIYVGGHQRWVNNSFGSDAAASGALPRPGIVALDPSNGLPFSWNPARNPRGAGAYAMFATPKGLYVGSDTVYIGNYQYYRGRIAFFPLAGGKTLPSIATSALPGNVYLAGQLATSSTSNVLYRINTAGSSIPALDSGPDWADDSTDPSPYRNSGSSAAGYGPVANVNAVVPTSTPSGIFSTERWDPGSQNDGGEMQWSFPVPANVPVEVRLYFANRYSGTSQVGQRVFDVDLDGLRVLNHYDIVADTGDQTGTMKPFDITTPANGQITINFTHEVENPLVNGIEIVRTDQSPPPPGAMDTLRSRFFDGTTAGSTGTFNDSSNTAWSQVRGAFMAGSTLFYGFSDGKLYGRTFDGKTLGASSLVDPYNDPYWSTISTSSGQTYRGVVPSLYGSEMQSVTGMAFSDGRLFYSLSGSSNLRWRWFTPESGVLGSDEFTASGSVNFSNIAGMFLSGDQLYYASKTTGDLHKVTFNSGAPSGPDTVVSGPSLDGNDWRAHGMFLVAVPQPVASFSTTCTGLACNFDGTASTAPGSSIASYVWNFGDGTPTASGSKVSHTFNSAGTYQVTLTVTNTVGASDTKTSSVTVSGVTSAIAYVGGSSTTNNAATESLLAPAGTVAGNTLVMAATSASATAPTAPAGWTLAGTATTSNGSSTTAVWYRTANGSETTTPTTVGFGATVHGNVTMLAYSGANPVSPVAAFASSGSTVSASSATTPTVNVAANGGWLLSYWAAKSSTVTTWNAPAAATSRVLDNGSGSGRVNSLAADSGGPVPVGAAGGLTATTDAAASSFTTWSLVLTS